MAATTTCHAESPARRARNSYRVGNNLAPFQETLGDSNLDAGFALLDESSSFSLSGAGRKIVVEFLTGYRYAQIYAPKDTGRICRH